MHSDILRVSIVTVTWRRWPADTVGKVPLGSRLSIVVCVCMCQCQPRSAFDSLIALSNFMQFICLFLSDHFLIPIKVNADGRFKSGMK